MTIRDKPSIDISIKDLMIYDHWLKSTCVWMSLKWGNSFELCLIVFIEIEIKCDYSVGMLWWSLERVVDHSVDLFVNGFAANKSLDRKHVRK